MEREIGGERKWERDRERDRGESGREIGREIGGERKWERDRGREKVGER